MRLLCDLFYFLGGKKKNLLGGMVHFADFVFSLGWVKSSTWQKCEEVIHRDPTPKK